MNNAEVSIQLKISAFDLREFSISTSIQNTKHVNGYIKLRRMIRIIIPDPFSS